MTLEEIDARMKVLGFRFMPLDGDGAVVGQYFRPCSNPRALVDGRQNVFEVKLYDHFRFRYTSVSASDPRFSFEAGVRGEFMPGRWTKIEAYGIRPEDFFEDLAAIETSVLRAWEAMKP